MADRASRHTLPRARGGARAIVVLLGLVLAIGLPAAALASTTSGTSGGDRVATLDAGTEATPAPDASANPGEGSGGSGSSWITSTPTPADSLVPIMLGAVVLAIVVTLMAMSLRESPKT